MPKKQRHTARRVFQRLVEEHDAEVSESSVRRYVGSVKKRQALALPDVCVPQHHPLGEEAEVDFGQVSFFLDGEPVEGWMFVMRLSASGKGFHRIYVNQAQEVFLDGHVAAFAHFGGVPKRIRYDNLKPAVVRVMQGRGRIETDRFIAMRSHYGFESFFCLPGVKGAHEKGGVEGEVGRFRRRHLVPVPDVASMEVLNELGGQGRRAGRPPPHRVPAPDRRPSTSPSEQPQLLALPDEPFEVELHLNCRVDTKARVCVRQSFYSVPVRYAGRRIDVRLGADAVLAMDGTNVVARHPRALGKGAQVLDLDHYLEVLSIKPGALAGASALVAARKAGAFTPLHQRFWDGARKKLGDQDGTRALIGVLLLHRTMDAATPSSAGMERALVDGHVRSRSGGRRGEAQPGSAGQRRGRSTRGSVAFDRPAPSIAHYDDLLGVG